MECMKRLAEQGRIIISSIHQPRAAIWDLFTKVQVLSEGRSLYFGPISQVWHRGGSSHVLEHIPSSVAPFTLAPPVRCDTGVDRPISPEHMLGNVLPTLCDMPPDHIMSPPFALLSLLKS